MAQGFATGSQAADVGGITTSELGVSANDFVTKKKLVAADVYNNELLAPYGDSDFVNASSIAQGAAKTITASYGPDGDYVEGVGMNLTAGGWGYGSIQYPCNSTNLIKQTFAVDTAVSLALHVPDWCVIRGWSMNGTDLGTTKDKWDFVAGDTLAEGDVLKFRVGYARDAELNEEIDFEPAGGEKTINILANEAWEIEVDDVGFVEVTPTSGTGNATVTVKAKDYTGQDEQAGVLELKLADGTTSYPMMVLQGGAAPFLRISPTTVNLAAEGGEQTTINVTSNVKWTVSEKPDWLSVSVESGENTGSVGVTADDNEVVESRSGDIVFKSEDETLTATCTVTQAAAEPYLNVTPTSLNFAAEGGEQTITIDTNLPWEIE